MFGSNDTTVTVGMVAGAIGTLIVFGLAKIGFPVSGEVGALIAAIVVAAIQRVTPASVGK
jgi:hypothetical protein